MNDFVKHPKNPLSYVCMSACSAVEVTGETYQIHKIVTFLSHVLCQANNVCQVLVRGHLILHGFLYLLCEDVNFFLRSPKEFHQMVK